VRVGGYSIQSKCPNHYNLQAAGRVRIMILSSNLVDVDSYLKELLPTIVL